MSGTAVAMQDKTLWMASGTLWYDGSSDILSELEVKEIYNGFDGLSRTDRIRYDTPVFGGFSLAGSYSSGDAFDGSVWYSREFSGTRVAAALGVANPGDIMSGADLLYTGSASVLFPHGYQRHIFRQLTWRRKKKGSTTQPSGGPNWATKPVSMMVPPPHFR